MIDWLFDATPFMPRHHCGRWTGPLAIAYVAANLLIALAYLGIPLMLYWTWRSYRFQANGRQWQVALFATFIFLCGIGHVIDGPMMFYWPNYRLATAWHMMTAAVSWATLLTMPGFLRRLVKEQ